MVNKNQEIALKIKAMANQFGWDYTVRSGVLTIVKRFTPYSNEEFVQADGEYYSILGLLPQSSPGSTWGTEGSGIGAVSAMKSGTFTMHKSGGNKNVLRELVKLGK